MRYYFASYGSSSIGFGNIYLKSEPHISIRELEKHIETETAKKGIATKCVVLYYKEISKKEYELNNIKRDEK